MVEWNLLITPPYHVKTDNVSESVHRLEINKIMRHQWGHDRGGRIAILYETHWKGLLCASWECESDLQQYRREILSC